MKLTTYDINGKSDKDIEISDKIFSQKPNKIILQTVIDWQISNFKVRTAKTKQRNEITGSTSKIYAQ